jgi:SWIM zinc finger
MKRTNPGPAMRHLGRLLAERTDSGRLVRGHEIFEDELVDELRIDGDRISAEIIGTREWPYEAKMRLPRAMDGSLPEDPWKLRFDCTCPDSGDPCKHGVALTLAVADLIDRKLFPGVVIGLPSAADDALDDQRRTMFDLSGSPSPGGSAIRPPAIPLPIPTSRPSWAEELGDRPQPTTLASWLGDEPPADTKYLDLGDIDALELILDLGPCEVPGGGPNLAGAIQLLVVRLLGGTVD